MRDCNNITVSFISQSPKNVTIAMEECGEPHCFSTVAANKNVSNRVLPQCNVD